MKKLLVVVIGILVIIGGYFAITYNSLVGLEESVNNSWAHVETNYQRRSDLIPNLVNTVKGYAEHESETLEKIAELRTRYNDANSPGELQELDNQLKTILNVTIEAYPDLKANENFLELQDELAGTENRIAITRRDYNNAVTKYNKKLRRFPTNIAASMFEFEKHELFKAETGSDKAPDVNF